jgi:hypothetical protein
MNTVRTRRIELGKLIYTVRTRRIELGKLIYD